MRSVDRLELQRRLKRQAAQKREQPDEETEEELDRPRFVPLNLAKSAFDEGADKTFGGINTAPSAFAKWAAFRSDEM